MLVVGLTGGIASGKSVITRVWKKEPGVLTIDADQIVHELYRPGTKVHQKLIEAFGTRIIGETGDIDRRALGWIVFRNKPARQKLNAIVHPAVQARLGEMAEEARANTVEILVVEAALLLESDPVDRSFFDCYVLATVDLDTQIERLMRRDRISREEALTRIRAQTPQEEKIKRADYLISTSGTREETVDRAKELLEKLRRRLYAID